MIRVSIFASIVLTATPLFCVQAVAQEEIIRCDDENVIDLFKESARKSILHFDPRSMRMDINVNDTISISETPHSAKCQAIAQTKLIIEGRTLFDIKQTIYYSVSRTNRGCLIVTSSGL